MKLPLSIGGLNIVIHLVDVDSSDRTLKVGVTFRAGTKTLDIGVAVGW